MLIHKVHSPHHTGIACPPIKAVYNPKASIPHAASLHQACAHCAIFPTAASRRSLGRISVPMWPVALLGRLPVDALVGHHPTNKLIGRDPIIWHKSFPNQTCIQLEHWVLPPVSRSYPQPYGRLVTHYSPVRHSHHQTKAQWIPFDLHVLSTPPAFVLSQNQTLHTKTVESPTQAHKKIKLTSKTTPHHKSRAQPHTNKHPHPLHQRKEHRHSTGNQKPNQKPHPTKRVQPSIRPQLTKTYKHKSSTKHALEFSNHHHTHQNTPPHRKHTPTGSNKKQYPPHPTPHNPGVSHTTPHTKPLHQTAPAVSVSCPARPHTPGSVLDGCPPPYRHCR